MWSRTRSLAIAILLSTAGSPAAVRAAEQRRDCLSEEETRQAMLVRKMIPPVRAVDAALRMAPGESVGIRLCRSEAAMVYDVVVLRHDGRLVHILVDAGSGTPVPSTASR